MHRKRLLIVVNVSWFFISHRLELAKRAASEHFDVHVATNVASERDRHAIESAGLTLHDLSIGRGDSGVLRDLLSLSELMTLVIKLRPSVMHVVTLKPILYGGLLAGLLRVPALVVAVPGLGHTFTDTGMWAGLRRAVVVLAMKQVGRHKNCVFIVQNVDDGELLARRGVVNSEKVRLIRGAGVDEEAYPFHLEQEGPVQVVLASRMLRTKGIPEFVACVRVLKPRWPQVRFVLAGMPDPSNPASLREDEIVSWHREGLVTWVGFIQHVASLFRSSHIVVLPTYYREGVPKVLIEAAASGRPIVTSDIPGCRDIVLDGVNGLLVPPRDVAALVVAVERLLADKGLREAFGRAGRERVRDGFTQEVVLRATLIIYRELLAKH